MLKLTCYIEPHTSDSESDRIEAEFADRQRGGRMDALVRALMPIALSYVRNAFAPAPSVFTAPGGCCAPGGGIADEVRRAAESPAPAPAAAPGRNVTVADLLGILFGIGARAAAAPAPEPDEGPDEESSDYSPTAKSHDFVVGDHVMVRAWYRLAPAMAKVAGAPPAGERILLPAERPANVSRILDPALDGSSPGWVLVDVGNDTLWKCAPSDVRDRGEDD